MIYKVVGVLLAAASAGLVLGLSVMLWIWFIQLANQIHV